MKKAILFFTGIVIVSSINCQVIKLQAGKTFSKLDWKNQVTNTQTFKDVFIGNSAFLGIDYLFKNNYNLSTNIGYVEKGGRNEVAEVDDNGIPTGKSILSEAQLNYYSFNTTVEYNYPLTDNFKPYFFGGPRIDYLYDYSQDFNDLKSYDDLNLISYGCTFGAGFKITVSKIFLGVKAEYYLNLNKIASWDANQTLKAGNITDETFNVMLMLGVRL